VNFGCYTNDELRDIARKATLELKARNKEQGNNAKTEFLDQVNFTVSDTNNEYSSGPVEIPESDCQLRDDHWSG